MQQGLTRCSMHLFQRQRFFAGDRQQGHHHKSRFCLAGSKRFKVVPGAEIARAATFDWCSLKLYNSFPYLATDHSSITTSCIEAGRVTSDRGVRCHERARADAVSDQTRLQRRGR